jgi:hypothetical protein
MRFFILLFFCSVSFAQVNPNVYIDQIGNNNSITVNQTDDLHVTNITMGKVSNTDNNTINVTQQDAGIKTTNIVLNSGIYNNISVNQQGTGNHIASVMNLNGSNNGINVNQSGAGSHTFNVDNWAGPANNGNNINATQSGGVGANKWFQVNLNGAIGSTVNVQQTGSTPDSASMLINCSLGCGGTWNYIRN